jgi:hypothetical protein
MPLPPIRPPDPAEVLASLIPDPTTGAPAPGPQYVLGANGEILEMREPETIIERLQAQQALGLTPAPAGPGRPPTGQAMPHGEQKADPSSGGSRSVVSESNHGPSGPPGSQT